MARLTTDEKILTKLDLILRVLALQIATQQESVTQGAKLLKLAGLDNKTIAKVLNTSDATVRALTSKGSRVLTKKVKK